MIITYNHAPYIAEAIESVLCQETDFPFTIHVIDDCSTDGTSDIVRDYAARYPDIVKPFINKKNLGNPVTQKNFYYGFSTLDGDYAAILEGDDYWISPYRLKAHVDFLEANPDFVACANNTVKIYQDGSKPPHIFQKPPDKDVHDIDDLIMVSSFFHASSLTFRNVFRGRVPRYMRSPLSCDIFITIAHAQHGKIKYFDEAWSVYRAHGGGLFSQMSQTKGWMWNIDSLQACNRWLGYRYFPRFAKSIYHYCDVLLTNGREEDGFTPEMRRKYTAVRRRYRTFDQFFRNADIALSRWIPGRRAKTTGATLNLGCGHLRYVPYVNVDCRKDVDADMIVDLEKTPWPWPDNYAGGVQFDHSLEHLGADFKTFQAIMRELYRVSMDGARVIILAKHPWNDTFRNDPTCVRVVSPPVLAMFDRGTSLAAKPEPVAVQNGVDFELVKRTAVLAEPYKSRFQNGQLPPEEAARLVDSSLNVCSDFQLELRVHKPPRSPDALSALGVGNSSAPDATQAAQR